MSFTIKCNKCGSEQIFNSNSKKCAENISIDVYVRGTFQGNSVESIDINCENLKCNNEIMINY